MSIDEPALAAAESVGAVRLLESRINDILAKAQFIKPTNTINPPLPAADFESDIPLLLLSAEDLAATNTAPSLSKGPNSPLLSTEDANALLETAIRNTLYPLVAEIPITDPAFISVWNLLDICGIAADAEVLQANFALQLIEEIFDSQTIVGCRRVFDYLESRREQLVPVISATEPKDDKDDTAKADKAKDDKATEEKAKDDKVFSNRLLIVIRTCNELLRRLSRAEDAVFCGRIFIFLFQSFPLGHKSSVNLRGEFHVENVTTFDELGPSEESNTDMMEVDKVEGADGESKAEPEAGVSNTPPVDKPNGQRAPATKESAAEKAGDEVPDADTLYRVFWSLQHVFSNPTKVFAQDELETFKRGLALTMHKFKSVTEVVQAHAKANVDGPRGLKRKRSRQEDEFASNFNPKYLTSRDLFELEMSDLTFQRHILVQALITIDFLLSLSPKAKERMPVANLRKELVYPYTLLPADEKWATETRSAISTYLQDGPGGKFYYRMADTVLSRDKNWVRWKQESCPPIVMDPMPSTSHIDAVNSTKRICTSRRIKANPMGATDTSFVSDSHNPNGLETLRYQDNVQLPDPAGCVREVETIDLDLEMATPAEKAYLDEGRVTATWKCLRIASRRRFAVLDKIDEDKGLANLLKDDAEINAAAKKQTKEPPVAEVKADGEEPPVAAEESHTGKAADVEMATGADGEAVNVDESAEATKSGDGNEMAVDEEQLVEAGRETDGHHDTEEGSTPTQTADPTDPASPNAEPSDMAEAEPDVGAETSDTLGGEEPVQDDTQEGLREDEAPAASGDTTQ